MAAGRDREEGASPLQRRPHPPCPPSRIQGPAALGRLPRWARRELVDLVGEALERVEADEDHARQRQHVVAFAGWRVVRSHQYHPLLLDVLADLDRLRVDRANAILRQGGDLHHSRGRGDRHSRELDADWRERDADWHG